MERNLTIIKQPARISSAGETEAGSAEEQLARDNQSKATNCRWGGGLSSAIPFYASQKQFGVLLCLKKPPCRRQVCLLIVKVICPIHAEPVHTLVAVGFALIYRTLRFIDFSYAFMFTISAYLALLSKSLLGLYTSLFVAVLLTSAIACVLELCLYRSLRKAGSSELVFFLVSLGIYVLFQNAVSMAFGDETRSIRTRVIQEGINIFGARITAIQLVTICVCIVLVTILSAFLKKSKIGKCMRAVANDSELANISGINSNSVILWTFAISSALAGLAGILVALDVDMTPMMGMNALMMGVVVVIIGGVNSISGIALGALLLATAQHLGAWYIGSQWQNAIAFVILVLFLLFKPEGFFGKKIRSATV